MNKAIKFTKQSPSFYAGDALHAIKQEKLPGEQFEPVFAAEMQEIERISK
jgi:hypothetical protein